ncbi:MAG: YkuS family protein [Peptostreptococcaceae bacterium]|nr:YkuS family protein [Peptostreptococcaceae bacterium]
MNKVYTIATQPGMDEVSKFLIAQGHIVCKDGTCGIKPDITLLSGIDMEWEQMNADECLIIDDESNKKMLLVNITGLSNEEILEKINTNYCF